MWYHHRYIYLLDLMRSESGKKNYDNDHCDISNLNDYVTHLHNTLFLEHKQIK